MSVYSSRFTNSIRDGVSKITNIFSKKEEAIIQEIGFDEYIWRSIEEGLDYCGEITYNLYDNKDYMPSLEQDYNTYFNGKEPNKQELVIFFGLLVTDLFPNYIEDNAILTLSEDGLSFKLELK